MHDEILQSNSGDLGLPSQPSSTLPLSNVTSLLLNTSVSKTVSVNCDGEQYGFKPDIHDCISILPLLPSGRDQVNFGPRGSGSSANFFPLPYRLMGGM